MTRYLNRETASVILGAAVWTIGVLVGLQVASAWLIGTAVQLHALAELVSP